MQLRAQDNGGIVVVNSSFAERLIAGGGWEEVVEAKPEPTPEPAPKPTRRGRRPAPAEEPTTQE